MNTFFSVALIAFLFSSFDSYAGEECNPGHSFQTTSNIQYAIKVYPDYGSKEAEDVLECLKSKIRFSRFQFDPIFKFFDEHQTAFKDSFLTSECQDGYWSDIPVKRMDLLIIRVIFGRPVKTLATCQTRYF